MYLIVNHIHLKHTQCKWFRMRKLICLLLWSIQDRGARRLVKAEDLRFLCNNSSLRRIKDTNNLGLILHSIIPLHRIRINSTRTIRPKLHNSSTILRVHQFTGLASLMLKYGILNLIMVLVLPMLHPFHEAPPLSHLGVGPRLLGNDGENLRVLCANSVLSVQARETSVQSPTQSHLRVPRRPENLQRRMKTCFLHKRQEEGKAPVLLLALSIRDRSPLRLSYRRLLRKRRKGVDHPRKSRQNHQVLLHRCCLIPNLNNLLAGLGDLGKAR